MLPGLMSSGQLRILIGVAAVALMAIAVSWLRSRLNVRRRSQREALWRELCLRLELVPQPREGRVAAGEQQGTTFSLHDTGADWLLEVPLPQPLLPPGVVLLPPKARGLRPRSKLRLLQSEPALVPPGAWRFYANPEQPPGKLEVTPAFVEEARLAAEAHAPLRVEQSRLVQALRTADPLSLNDVREAVRSLDTTARRWLEAVERHGLPRLRWLPRLPSAFSILYGVLARRVPLRWLILLNVGLPLTVSALLLVGKWLFFVLLVASLPAARRLLGQDRSGFRGFVLCGLMLASTFAAPWVWVRDRPPVISAPPVISVREASLPGYRDAKAFRFTDAVLRPDLATPGRGLVPVVSRQWYATERIDVFAVKLPPASWDSRMLEGVTVPRTSENIHAAIVMGLERNFVAHPHHVLFVDFSIPPPKPITQEPRMNREALLLWGIPNALWFGAVLVLWGRDFRRSRRVREGEEPSETTYEE